MALVVPVAAIALGTVPAEAKVFEPTRLDDPVPNGCKPRNCSLREAVIRANARDGRDTIKLRGGARYISKLDTLFLTDDAVIRSSGPGRRATVDAGTTPEVLFAGFPKGEIQPTVRLSGLTIRGAENSGGVEVAGGRLTISRSAIVGNDGGGVVAGLFAAEARVVIRRSTIARNRAQNGGGVAIGGGSVAVVKNSTIARNGAWSGGGLSASDAAGLIIVNSTIAENEAVPLEADGTAFGGGILHASSGALRLNAVTIARNVVSSEGTALGGGIAQTIDSPIEIANSVLAANDASSSPDCIGNFSSGGGNLLTSEAACNGFGDRDALAGNARIGRLRRNGGPTETIALRRRSRAIGLARRRSAPKRDQRGTKRDRRPDAGAFERNRREPKPEDRLGALS